MPEGADPGDSDQHDHNDGHDCKQCNHQLRTDQEARCLGFTGHGRRPAGFLGRSFPLTGSELLKVRLGAT